ncbi:MAG: hypothetical protein DRO94_04340 [Candidatus Altiarchaeales archaeon]|nr:MAG: hypothetical protein DRO95_03620 [Candidatus Altiarchaeales archaeon]RLI93817.1 MAG: hypothetical protein DRO94_04340 [Candidatus Altiarchaeales archaeon]
MNLNSTDLVISEINKRISDLRNKIEELGLDAFLVFSSTNVRYLTSIGTGAALITGDDAILWVRDLYREIYAGLYSNEKYAFDIFDYEKGVIESYINNSDLEKIGIENLRLSNYEKIREKILRKELIRSDAIEQLRAMKSDLEINLLKKSAELSVKGMETAYKIIKPGVREIDAAAEIEYRLRKDGSESPPFGQGALLSSGERSADIHAFPTENRIENNSIVIVDIGARFLGYYSDMTRTIPVGSLNTNDREIVEFVRNLELECIDMLYDGIEAREIYEFAEKRINARGFRLYHPLGHGIGLDVHELPSLSRDSEDSLKNGMVFTIEPGVYIPRKFGVRFEDMVLLRKKAKILTNKSE